MEETRNYINLVLTVKKYPALYDLSCNDYHNKVVRNKMWKTVAQEVNASAAECKEKWKNLRASFSRHLRNQNTANSKSKKPYYMADYMDFLLPYSKLRRPNDGLNEESQLMQECYNDEEIASDTSSTYEKSNKSDQKIPMLNKENGAKNEIKFANDRLLTQRWPDNYILSNRQEFDDSTNDPDWLFFKSLLPDIHQMTSQEKRNFKISVLNLIDKIFNERETSICMDSDALCSIIKSQQDEKGD